MRPIDTVDVEDVRALPRLRCVRCPARVAVRTTLRNLTAEDARGGPDAARARAGRGRAHRAEAAEAAPPARARVIGTRVDIERPRLWQPGRPVSTRSRRRRTWSSSGSGRGPEPGAGGTYRLSFGVRKLETPPRRALPERPPAAAARREHPRGRHRRPGRRSPRPRARSCCARLRDLGATVTRSHYPLHPAFLEALRPARDPLLGAGSRSTSCPTRSSTVRGVRGSATRAVRLTVDEQPEPPVGLRVVARERAGRQPLRARRDRPRPRDLHPRGRRRGARDRRHAPDRHRPPVADRRAAHRAPRTATSTRSA